jgi:hypothetical protein
MIKCPAWRRPSMPKKYSINWEDDIPVSFEVDGVVYERLDQVPDESDRAKLEAMINGSIERQFEKEFKGFDKDFQKDWEAHKKTAAGAEKVILGIFTGVAILMLLIAAASSANAMLKMSRTGLCKITTFRWSSTSPRTGVTIPCI